MTVNTWCAHMLCMLCSLENINHCNRAILQDPATYHSPETFIPERYEGTDGHPPEPDLSYVSFGFGTRCVLIHRTHRSWL